jgi:hypothetical protein
MKKGVRVVTNFPVFVKGYHETGYSYKWDKSLCYENINDTVFIIDESYRDFNSRNYKDFTTEEHTFFATSGHNGNDFYFLVQNVNRLDKVIREVANYFLDIWKISIPLTNGYPLLMVCEWFYSLERLESRWMTRKGAFKVQRYMLKRKIAKAYDDKYFRKEESPDLVIERWEPKEDNSPTPGNPKNNLKRPFFLKAWLGSLTHNIRIRIKPE